MGRKEGKQQESSQAERLELSLALHELGHVVRGTVKVAAVRPRSLLLWVLHLLAEHLLEGVEEALAGIRSEQAGISGTSVAVRAAILEIARFQDTPVDEPQREPLDEHAKRLYEVAGQSGMVGTPFVQKACMRMKTTDMEECPNVMVQQRVSEAEERIHRIGWRAPGSVLEIDPRGLDEPSQRAIERCGSRSFMAPKGIERLGRRQTTAGALETMARGVHLFVAGMAAQ